MKKKIIKFPLMQNSFRMKNLFLLILLIFLLLFIFFSNNIKVCICAIGKNENKYIREFIEHYKHYKIDKIFIYDNNDINGEYFQEVLNDYIEKKYIEIINFRGRKKVQLLSYKDCYKNHYMFFDWFIIFDLDEYIYLKNYNNIKAYLNNKRFKSCQVIRLNLIFLSDNNLLKYDNRPLKERFPLRAKYTRKPKNKNLTLFQIKSIIKGKIPNFEVRSIHWGTNRYNIYNVCNGFGNIYRGYYFSDYEYYYIIHYFSKSTEEFIDKIKRGDAIYPNKTNGNILKYFAINNITLEKINMFEKELKINLSSYRKRLKKN